jgi:hypothetical protein
MTTPAPDDLAAQLRQCAADLTSKNLLVAEAARGRAPGLMVGAADRLEAVEREHADLMAVVVQPWDRDGDGTVRYKINLAWWDSADTEERAHEMIAELVARVKARATKGS